MLIAIIFCLCTSAFALAKGQAEDTQPVCAKVVEVRLAESAVVIGCGLSDGVRAGDRVLFVTGTRVATHGAVSSLQSDTATVRCASIADGEDVQKCAAIVVTAQLETGAFDRWSRFAYRVTQVDSVLPGGERLWMDAGSVRGWRTGDAILLRRRDVVVGWGTVDASYDDVSMAKLTRSRPVRISPQRGDVVERIGDVSETRRLRTRVAAVESDGDGGGPLPIVLAGDAAAGLGRGDRFDIFRDGEYVAFARVTVADPVIRAEAPASFQRRLPESGDVAIRRSGGKAIAHAGYVFRLEPDYALIGMGESDGVFAGQTLLVVRGGHTSCRLSVRRVYPDHCGAVIVDRQESDASPIRLWDRVVTVPPLGSEVERDRLRRATGIQPVARCPWVFRIDAPREVGSIVALRDDAMGIVVATDSSGALVVRFDGLRYDSVPPLAEPLP